MGIRGLGIKGRQTGQKRRFLGPHGGEKKGVGGGREKGFLSGKGTAVPHLKAPQKGPRKRGGEKEVSKRERILGSALRKAPA